MRRRTRIATIAGGIATATIAAVTAIAVTSPPAAAPVPAVPAPTTRTAPPTTAAPPSPTSRASPPRTASTPAPVGDGGFTASPLDVNGQVKEVAARFVQRVGSWTAATAADPAARLAAAGYPADLVPMAGTLVTTPARQASTTIVYPQYGGLTATSASVMVLARQSLLLTGGERVRELLLDVRVALAADGSWAVTPVVDPPRPAPAPALKGGPTALGRAVLANPRIRIPGPGRADITGRRVGDPILAVLDRLSRTRTLDVQVLVSGHPGTVFPTRRVSNHTVGRAVDVRAIDGAPVVAIPRNDPRLAEFMIAAGRAGATEVGGPIVPPGRGFFSDAVHQDHFHLGITPTKPRAGAVGGR